MKSNRRYLCLTITLLVAALAGGNAEAADLNVATGEKHSCGWIRNGPLKCWGGNAFGQLGLGDTMPRGSTAGSMGNALKEVVLTSGGHPVRVALGDYHGCALMDNGDVKCWGDNNYGQLGLGDTNHRGDAPGEMGNNLPAIELGTDPATNLPVLASEIGAFGYHSCAMLSNGKIKCWGNNNDGQLGQGDNLHRGDGAYEMGDFLSFVSLGPGRRATKVTGGGNHVCALLDERNVKCWGWNTYGQLGLGDTNSGGDAVNEMGNFLPAIDLGTR